MTRLGSQGQVPGWLWCMVDQYTSAGCLCNVLCFPRPEQLIAPTFSDYLVGGALMQRKRAEWHPQLLNRTADPVFFPITTCVLQFPAASVGSCCLPIHVQVGSSVQRCFRAAAFCSQWHCRVSGGVLLQGNMCSKRSNQPSYCRVAGGAVRPGAELQLTHRCAVQIQAHVRGWLLRKAVFRQQSAATCIRAAWLCHKQRQQQHLQQLAASCCCYKHICGERLPGVCISSSSRQRFASRLLSGAISSSNCYTRHRASAITIQAAVRMHQLSSGWHSLNQQQ